ncbi:hypothetical protein BV898_18211 [Hypsibius exemplaris]|uniref:Uncharacterized protein n=1 Tax=Hypsibius exemplaris TaxID=2072580 RepID=A0A9X6NGF0_HYPEX|nr:hypothetical protein BV898_18211 [Hypsibius exemplaris]
MGADENCIRSHSKPNVKPASADKVVWKSIVRPLSSRLSEDFALANLHRQLCDWTSTHRLDRANRHWRTLVATTPHAKGVLFLDRVTLRHHFGPQLLDAYLAQRGLRGADIRTLVYDGLIHHHTPLDHMAFAVLLWTCSAILASCPNLQQVLAVRLGSDPARVAPGWSDRLRSGWPEELRGVMNMTVKTGRGCGTVCCSQSNGNVKVWRDDGDDDHELHGRFS